MYQNRQQLIVPTLIFDQKQAKQITVMEIYEISFQALKELESFNNQFIQFENDIFSKQSITCEPETMKFDKLKQLHNTIMKYLKLLAIYFNNNVALQSMEYLVRRYRIDQYLWPQLLEIFINYSDTEYYSRIVNICKNGQKIRNQQVIQQLYTLSTLQFPIQKENLYYLLKQSNCQLLNDLIRVSKELYGTHKREYQKWLMNAMLQFLNEKESNQQLILKQFTSLILYDLQSNKKNEDQNFLAQLGAYYLILLNNFQEQLTKQWKQQVLELFVNQDKFMQKYKIQIFICCYKLNQKDIISAKVLTQFLDNLILESKVIKQDQNQQFKFSEDQLQVLQIIIYMLDFLTEQQVYQISQIISKVDQQTLELFIAKLIVLIEYQKVSQDKFNSFIQQVKINKNIINNIKIFNVDNIKFLSKYCNDITLYQDDIMERINSTDPVVRCNCFVEISKKLKDSQTAQDIKETLVRVCVQALEHEDDIQSLRILLGCVENIDKLENITEQQIIKLYKLIIQKQSQQIYDMCQLLTLYIQKSKIQSQNIDKILYLLNLQQYVKKQQLTNEQIQQVQQLQLFPYKSVDEIRSAVQVNVHQKSIILIQIICNLKNYSYLIDQFIITQIQESEQLQNLSYNIFCQCSIQNQIKLLTILSEQQITDFVNKQSIDQILYLINEIYDGQHLKILTQRLIQLLPDISNSQQQNIALITLPGSYIKYNQFDLFTEILKVKNLPINPTIKLFWTNDCIKVLYDILDILYQQKAQLSKQQSYYFMQYVLYQIKQSNDQEQQIQCALDLMIYTFKQNLYHQYAYELIRRVLNIIKNYNDTTIENTIIDLFEQKYENATQYPDSIIDGQEIESIFILIDYLKLIHAKFENKIPIFLWIIGYKDYSEEQISQLCFLRNLCEQKQINECQKICLQLLNKAQITLDKITVAVKIIPLAVVKQLQIQDINLIEDPQSILTNLYDTTPEQFDEQYYKQFIQELLKLYIRFQKEKQLQLNINQEQPDYSIIVNDLPILGKYLSQENLITVLTECYKQCDISIKITKEIISTILETEVDVDCIPTITELFKIIIQIYIYKLSDQEKENYLYEIVTFTMEKIPEYLAGILLFVLTENCPDVNILQLMSMFDQQIQLGTLSTLLGYCFNQLYIIQCLQEQNEQYRPLDVLDSFLSEAIENKLDTILSFVKQVISKFDQIDDQIDESFSMQSTYQARETQPYIFFIHVLMNENSIDRTFSLAVIFSSKLNQQQIDKLLDESPIDISYIMLYTYILQYYNEKYEQLQINISFIEKSLQKQFYEGKDLHLLIQQILVQQNIDSNIQIDSNIKKLLLQYIEILFECQVDEEYIEIVIYNLAEIISLTDNELIQYYQNILKYIKSIDQYYQNQVLQKLVQQPHSRYISFILSDMLQLNMNIETIRLLCQNANVKIILNIVEKMIEQSDKQPISQNQIKNIRQILFEDLEYNKITRNCINQIISLIVRCSLEFFNNCQLSQIFTKAIQNFDQKIQLQFIDDLLQQLYYKQDINQVNKLFQDLFQVEFATMLYQDYQKYVSILSLIEAEIDNKQINLLLFQTVSKEKASQQLINQLLSFYLQKVTIQIEKQRVDEEFIGQFCQNIKQINKINQQILTNQQSNEQWRKIGKAINQDQFLQLQLSVFVKCLIDCKLSEQIYNLMSQIQSENISNNQELKGLIQDLRELQEDQQHKQSITKIQLIFSLQILQSEFNNNDLQLSACYQKSINLASQAVLDEIFQRYKNIIVTKQRFTQLLNRIHKQLYETQFNEDISQQLDSRFIIEVIRQLDSESPLIFIDDQILPYIAHRMIPVDFKEIGNQNAYYCQKCHNVMYEGVSLNCQHYICKKCLYANNKQTFGTLSMSSIISSQKLENIIDHQLSCPICNQKITYCQELNEINAVTRKLHWHCCYSQCQFTGQFDAVVNHIQQCPYGQKELESHIEPWKQLVEQQTQEIIRLKKQLRAQLDNNQQSVKDLERRLSMPMQNIDDQVEQQNIQDRISQRMNTQLYEDQNNIQQITHNNQQSTTNVKQVQIIEQSTILQQKQDQTNNHIHNLTIQSGNQQYVKTIDQQNKQQTQNSSVNPTIQSPHQSTITTQSGAPFGQLTTGSSLSSSLEPSIAISTLQAVQIQQHPQQKLVSKQIQQSQQISQTTHEAQQSTTQQPIISDTADSTNENTTSTITISHNVVQKVQSDDSKQQTDKQVQNQDKDMQLSIQQVVQSQKQDQQQVQNTQTSIEQIQSEYQPTVASLKYISSLDYDICFLNLLRYTFYGKNFQSRGQLEQICLNLRQYLMNGANERISLEVRYENLKSFISLLANFYCFLQSNTDFYKFLIKHYQPINNLQNSRMLSTFVRSYNDQDKLIQGGYVAKAEFGQQSRKWLLEELQKFKNEVQRLQAEIAALENINGYNNVYGHHGIQNGLQRSIVGGMRMSMPINVRMSMRNTMNNSGIGDIQQNNSINNVENSITSNASSNYANGVVKGVIGAGMKASFGGAPINEMSKNEVNNNKAENQ